MARTSPAAPAQQPQSPSGGAVTPGARPPKRFAAKVHTEAVNVSKDDLPAEISRADLVLVDTEHGGHTFETRVFLNNPAANADTPLTPDSGYAGTFHVFGHGGCFGDAGHCEVNDRGKSPTDLRGLHPLTPMRKEITVTDALKRALQSGDLKKVTLVPLAIGRPVGSDPANEDVLRYGSLKLLTYA
jgi:hypothetical protein